MVLVTLTQLQFLVEILRQILYLFDLRPHLHLNHQQLFLLDICSLCSGDVAIEVFEAVIELGVFHVVKIIDFLLKLLKLSSSIYVIASIEQIVVVKELIKKILL